MTHMASATPNHTVTFPAYAAVPNRYCLVRRTYVCEQLGTGLHATRHRGDRDLNPRAIDGEASPAPFYIAIATPPPSRLSQTLDPPLLI